MIDGYVHNVVVYFCCLLIALILSYVLIVNYFVTGDFACPWLLMYFVGN